MLFAFIFCHLFTHSPIQAYTVVSAIHSVPCVYVACPASAMLSCYHFFYIAVIRLVALFAFIQFSVAQISGCRFFPRLQMLPFFYDSFFRCPIFSLPFPPLSNFPVAHFSCCPIFPLPNFPVAQFSRCPFFLLPNFPVAQFSVALFSVAFLPLPFLP